MLGERLSSKLTPLYARFLPGFAVLYTVLPGFIFFAPDSRGMLPFVGLWVFIACGAATCIVWLARLATVYRHNDVLTVSRLGRLVEVPREAIHDMTQLFLFIESVKLSTYDGASFRFIAPKHLLWPWQDNPDFCALREWAGLRRQGVKQSSGPAFSIALSVAAITAAGLGTGFLLGSALPASHYDSETTATVEYCSYRNSSSCRYGFSVGSADYEGHVYGHHHPGESLHVTFDSNDPESSSARPDPPGSTPEIPINFWAACFIGLSYGAGAIWLLFVR